jgi:hypothetical protein
VINGIYFVQIDPEDAFMGIPISTVSLADRPRAKSYIKERKKSMPKIFRRSDIIVQKSLAPPFSTVVGIDSDDFGYEASYDGYSSTGDTEDEAIDNLVDKLLDKGYEEE